MDQYLDSAITKMQALMDYCQQCMDGSKSMDQSMMEKEMKMMKNIMDLLMQHKQMMDQEDQQNNEDTTMMGRLKAYLK